MSRVVLHEPGLMVADAVLPPELFKALGRDVAHSEFRSVHAQKWDKSWRLWDGNPLRGESVYFDPSGLFRGNGAAYPTGGVVDVLIEQLRAWAGVHPDLVGREGSDWVALYLAPWIYPVGSALSLHRDGEQYSGAFTYFVHSRWRTHWGGELLVSQQQALEIAPAAHEGDAPWMSGDGNADADPGGIATCITPLPNRLVLLGPDRPHRVARVDQNAGLHVRASMAGFFLRAP
ncbi:hypothetical protein HF313_09160 [Massilia atriviolacea]|uniref:Prolyl 4-hydroxylase alpha subunit Fe(2+) 2OG dioxygenase domain-containing protein n=1 Tax=Massilia atriviolacea TaxID=2495579 RepID=A0A430HDB4_9BURK|nr:2OG-Fe(II) oxygenase [Massilia atriviolacea]RSZ55528.1 hypothetical protein EJB06_28640 [Massilia atriviolacea]